jgi:hypothetical protein
MWHRDLPPNSEEVMDVIAKALLLRAGGSVVLSDDELRQAANTQAEVELRDGDIAFRVERN